MGSVLKSTVVGKYMNRGETHFPMKGNLFALQEYKWFFTYLAFLIWLLAFPLTDTQMLCGCADALATRRLKASFLNGKLPLSSWCPVPLPLYLPTPPPQYSYLQGTANVCRSNIEGKKECLEVRKDIYESRTISHHIYIWGPRGAGP